MTRKSSPKVHLFGYAMGLALLPLLSVFNQPAFVQANEPTVIERNEPKTDSAEFFIVVGPNATESELEKLSRMSFSFDRKLILDRNADNKLIGYTLKGKGSSSGITLTAGADRLPSVVYAKKGYGGAEDQLSLGTIDEILAADWDKTKIYCVGLPTNKQAIAALRPKALAIYEADQMQRLIQLKALNWVHTYERGHTTYNTFTEKALNHLKNRAQKCKEGNLELIVSINGGTPQNTLPVLENLKLSRIEAHDKIAHYYQENTTKLIKEEPAGLRLEIFTEE